ncbi:hypothetical protein Hanom_Chr03g00184581 [Helianthus anomalus]
MQTNPNFVYSSLCVIVDCEYSVYSLFSHLPHLLYKLYVVVRDTRWFLHIACVFRFVCSLKEDDLTSGIRVGSV